MPHSLINNELQNTDKKHIKKMKKYLHISENSVTHTHTHTHTHTQLADKGLNNDLYNYRGGIFPIGGNTASFCLFLAGHTVGLWKERRKNGVRKP